MAIEVPEVLRNADTEPEAAHLRNVLRRLQAEIERGSISLAESDVERHDQKLLEIIETALMRPRTNGRVIDQLNKLNGDLQTSVLDLRARVSVLEMELAFERNQSRSFWAWLRQRYLCWRRGHEMVGSKLQRQCLHCGKEKDAE